MPKDTFFNLPEEKRRRIIELATDEFAQHTYHRASLSRIVERAGIAKGSMYQYFEDKFDLYSYLLELGGQAKLAAVNEAVARLGPGADLQERLLAATEASLALAETNPQLYALGMNLLRETDKGLVARVLERLQPLSDNIFAEWLQDSMARGLVDPSVSPATAFYMFSAVTLRVGQDIADGRLTVDQAVLMLQQMLLIISEGMRPRKMTPAAGGAHRKGSEEDR
ncbi:MAG: TetR/AcrR family transcriptional regulator [Bacillota bacterium]